MTRTRVIFDWIFGLDGAKQYKLFYLQLESPNVGLAQDALLARRNKEARSVTSAEAFAMKYRTLDQVWLFLNTEHELYTASKLVKRGGANQSQESGIAELVKKSYGDTS